MDKLTEEVAEIRLWHYFEELQLWYAVASRTLEPRGKLSMNGTEVVTARSWKFWSTELKCFDIVAKVSAIKCKGSKDWIYAIFNLPAMFALS